MTQDKRHKDLFSTRTALILAALGMAIGSGNIWRFPRIMAKFEGGGGTFLIPWAIFLFTWSIPLLIVEASIGRKTGKGVISSLGQMLGKRWTFIGAFVALCTIAIMCYYAVIAGWCGIYVLESLSGTQSNLDTKGAIARFEDLAQGKLAVYGMLAAFAVAGFFVSRGIRRGVELANKLLLPTLLLILLVLIVRSLSLDGSGEGISYMFRVDWKTLGTASPWLEGLTQSAWSTGAGWGLLLVLAIASSKRGNNVGDALITGIGNNIASLIAAMATIPAVFALAPKYGEAPLEVLAENGPGNTGMAMVWLPRLFEKMGESGPWFAALFFVALTFAATTSLIAMVELGTRVLMDLGIDRRKGILFVCAFGCLFGLPSAMSLEVLANQDWAWGIGLMVSGFIIYLAVAKVGFEHFRTRWINTKGEGIQLGSWFNLFLMIAIPLQFFVLIGWWFWQSSGWEDVTAWDPFQKFSISTCLFQWGIAFLLLFLFNKKLSAGIEETG